MTQIGGLIHTRRSERPSAFAELLAFEQFGHSRDLKDAFDGRCHAAEREVSGPGGLGNDDTHPQEARTDVGHSVHLERHRLRRLQKRFQCRFQFLALRRIEMPFQLSLIHI